MESAAPFSFGYVPKRVCQGQGIIEKHQQTAGSGKIQETLKNSVVLLFFRYRYIAKVTVYQKFFGAHFPDEFFILAFYNA